MYLVDSALLSKVLASIVAEVTKDEPQITKYDTIAGDGDCGETLLKGVNGMPVTLSKLLPLLTQVAAVQQAFSKTTQGNLDLAPVFRDISTTVEKSMGGTSGAIYAIFFNAVANSLTNNISASASPESIPKALSSALQEGLIELCRYTAARKGHKTLMDALFPFVESFAETLDFGKAIELANEGAGGTRTLDAVLGRASYVSKDNFEREGGVPDPGALGVVTCLRGIQKALGGN
jgi:dihydroxyacetone kinase